MINATETPHASDAPDPRLENARRDFLEARAALEQARKQLLRAHVEATRLWAAC